MRLLLKLQCLEDNIYDLQYHYHLQSVIYSFLKDGKFDFIHNKLGYKFFCFSNIFPVSYLRKNDVRNLIISSPNQYLISYLYHKLQRLMGSFLEIGKMKFSLSSVDQFEIELFSSNKITIVTGTPIIIRIPIEQYDLYGYKISKDYAYVYWRKDHPIELFVKQLESNLIKKYIQYCETVDNYGVSPNSSKLNTNYFQDTISFWLFQNFKLKKQISSRIPIKGTTHIVIGTLWEFSFNLKINSDSIQILQFLLDVGLGERNSLGFGFMNLL